MTTKLKLIFMTYHEQILLAPFGLFIGAIVGAMDALFGRVLLFLTDVRVLHPLLLIPFLPLAGVIIAFFYKRYGGASSRGMDLVFAVGHGEEEVIPLRLVPFVISGTWLTHLFGGSAGREGVAVQIGATLSHWLGKRLPVKNASSIFLVTGMAAGFSGLFGTPIAATLFALEVLVAGSLKYRALLPAFTAAYAASSTAQLLGLEKFSFPLTSTLALTPATWGKLILLGFLFGIIGGGFAWCLKKAKNIAKSVLPQAIIRIFVMGIALSILLLLFYQGRYSGLGTNLITSSFSSQEIKPWDWFLKFILTIITLSAGFQGGEVTPLFAIGASLGVILAGLLNLPPALVAALGYASVFGSASNTLLAPIMIGAEVFGFQNLPYFFIVCSISYVFNMNKSIYAKQRKSTNF
ncbi:MAG TPA: chloride channel protein [Candidatus Dorea intestinavium]|nr:chloride channel protein [Candidatus Dorea intestinavium]